MSNEDIEIVHLRRGEEPPGDEDYVLVEVTASGTVVTAIAAQGKAVLRQGPFVEFSDAMDAAYKHSSARKMEAIYIKGAPRK